MNRLTFLLVLTIAAATQLCAGSYAVAEDAKLQAFTSQYGALGVEGIALWQAVQRANLTQDARLLSLQRDMLNFKKRLSALSLGIREHSLQRGRESLARGVEPVHEADYTLIAATAEAMLYLLEFASTYLDVKQPLYLRVALEYERAWSILDDQVRRKP